MKLQSFLSKGGGRSVKRNVLLYVGLLLLTVCGGITLANLMSDRMDKSRELRFRTDNIALVLADVGNADLRYREVGRLERLISTFGGRFNIMGIVIVDGEGVATVEYDAGDTPSLDPLRAAAEEARLSGDIARSETRHSYVTARPVEMNGEVVGSVAIALGKAEMLAVTVKSILWNLSLSLIVALIAFTVTLLILKRISDPLTKLTEFAEGVRVGRMSDRISIRTGDEFERLGNAMNRMLERIDSSLEQIRRLAFVNSVTDLPNRDLFTRHVEGALAKRSGAELVAVIQFNVDRFRWVNETMGPQKGDEALSLIGLRISKSMATADKTVRMLDGQKRPSIISRLGADEFAVLVPSVSSKEDIARIVQMTIASMRQPLELAGQTVSLGLAAGAAFAPDHGETAETLMRNADLALKEAKRSGRGKSRLFSSKLNQAAQDQITLEADLRTAIANDEFEPFFQPKVDFRTGAICGAEALVRWRRADGSLVSPGLFIPMAEHIGLISSIGDTVLRKSCIEAAAWMRSGFECKVAVNVSPLQLEEPNFAEKVLIALREASLPPGRLELEITESLAVNDPERVSEIMRPLRAMGVRLAIDDFGAGHSNLGTLTKLPFDVFKIDQQFVSALHSDKQAPAICDMILALAETLGLETVAEGVETVSQSDFLRRRGCTIAQGYLYSRPLPANEILPFLENWTPFGGLPVEQGIDPMDFAPEARIRA